MSTSDSDDALKRDAMAEMDQLLDKSQPERARHLGALAHSRPELHALVMDLLGYEDPVNRGFMEPGKAASLQALHAGTPLGPYRIIRLLGEGGMGEVWLASRDDGLYEGQVAIKTLHPYFAGGALRERFLREAKVLGRLAHSNIARLLDAGIHDGVVYLVLEYVIGRPIDVACDEERLRISARLGIFLQLCGAVAHAHSSLVVHRDIKPGNVLLAADGVPKLLDFGIASFFESETGEAQSDITRLTGRVFTPEYAAPEQVLGQEITTATDVYSLGVLLYVLLTGQLPYKPVEGGRTQWDQAVLQQEPQRMARTLDLADHDAVAASRSTPIARLRRELSGDLEIIVQKALKKRPEDRYLTVAAFADDVRRYLSGEPVLARPDSAWYRLSKFARRNRLAVSATVAVVVALGAGLALSLWQLQVARSERRRAEEVKEFVASIFRSADPFFTGKESMSAADLLLLARERIDLELAAQPDNAVELLTLVGESQSNLSQDEAAKASLAKAIALAERQEPRNDILLAEARGRLMSVASSQGEFALVRSLAAQALPDLRAHRPETSRSLSDALIALAYAESDAGEVDAAIAHAREAVAAVSAALGDGNSETISGRNHLANFLMDAKRFDEARPIVEKSLRDARALSASGGSKALLVQAENQQGALLVMTDDIEAGIVHLNTAMDLASKLYGPKSFFAMDILSMLGRAQGRLGDFKALLVTRRRAYEAAEGDLIKARMLTNLGRATLAARQVSESLDPLRRAVELEKQYDTEKGTWLALCQSDYGAALALSGRFDEADRVLQATLPIAKETVMAGSLASTWNAIGLSRQLQSQWIESEQAFRQALENTQSADLNQKQRAEALLGIGVARLAQGDAADAEKWFLQADESARITFLNLTPLRADIAMHLGRALLEQKKTDAALASLGAARGYWRDYDAGNRSAGAATYWMGRGYLVADKGAEARAALLSAIEILKGSTLPGDVRLVADARREVARL